MSNYPKPVVIMSSVLTGLNVFVGGVAFVENVPRWVAGLAALLVAATTAGWGSYVHGRVTPYERELARLDSEGKVVSGPAALAVAGIRPGTEVAVVRTEPTPYGRP